MVRPLKKPLYMILHKHVSELLNPDPLIVLPTESVGAVRRLMRDTGVRVVLVSDRKGRLLGWVPRRVILNISSRKTSARIKNLMEDPPILLEPQDRLKSALDLMLRHDEWYAPVIESGKIKGLLGLEHVIKAALENASNTLSTVKIQDIMTHSPLHVKPDEFISGIWNLMRKWKYAGFPVVDDKYRLVGIITQFDLLRKGYTRIELESESGPHRGPRVRDAMTTSVVYLYPWSNALEAAKLMVNRGLGRIPIVESEDTKRLVGIVDREDVVRILLRGAG
ncbi:MAG: CBS domain-containing protein [Desulfurococcales archaeon]|nr:CBS domain-containing protein [Desulfurococcales archaeon]